ncbi:MAG: hypothetical protein A4E65_00810 [Syntrophorhabdus sp. PtaU1.Bin153]|nr:MAG: hypothetical protein A4E65_00810 [Syntrophorhabdus sp. PtaU1.Bin153]
MPNQDEDLKNQLWMVWKTMNAEQRRQWATEFCQRYAPMLCHVMQEKHRCLNKNHSTEVVK